MDCLTNLVAIWDGCSDREAGKLYINDLPGFDLKIGDRLANAQVIDGMEFLQNTRSSAAVFLKQEILGYLGGRAKIGSVIANQTAGFIDENKYEYLSESGKYKGLQIAIPQRTYLSLYVDKISIFTKNSITTNVQVIDVQQGIVIDTIPVTTLAGQITYVNVRKTYQANGQYLNLVFAIDSSLTDVYRVITSFSSSCGCMDWTFFNDYTSGRGVEINSSGQLIERNLRALPHTGGISLYYSIQCDHEQFICNMATAFEQPMFFRFGIEICKAIIYSQKLNSLTTIGKDKAREMLADLTEQYNGCMNNIMQGLELPENICYQCTPRIMVNTRIP